VNKNREPAVTNNWLLFMGTNGLLLLVLKEASICLPAVDVLPRLKSRVKGWAFPADDRNGVPGGT
jgi:hypothetical protein